MNSKLTFLLLLITLSISTAQTTIRVEAVHITETIDHNSVSKIPRVRDSVNPSSASVSMINDYILDIFSLESYDKNRIKEFRWYEVDFKSEIAGGILYIAYGGEYVGAYPNYVEEELYFDLASGKRMTNVDIPFQALFAVNGYLDFVNQFWLAQVKKAFKTAMDCSEGEQLYCSYYDISSYSLNDNVLSIQLTNDCYPRVIQACAPSLSKSISVDSIKSFLSEVGQRALLIDRYTARKGIDKFLYNRQIWSEVPNTIFLFGLIDGKYAISMALNLDKKGTVSGYYYYDRKGQKIALRGTHNKGSMKLIESVNGKTTGSFNFTWDKQYDENAFALFLPEESLYLKGTWSNPDKTKTLVVKGTKIKVTSPFSWGQR